ncbi:MAG: hypothetical protein AAGI23_07760 [Bacteroidota bacterium]
MNKIRIGIVGLLTIFLVACDNSTDKAVAVDDYTIDTEKAEAIPKEIYEQETALSQDNITYAIDDYDERLRLMEEEVLSMIPADRHSFEATNRRLRLSLDTLKSATAYPNGTMPTDDTERQQIERILQQLASEIRDL